MSKGRINLDDSFMDIIMKMCSGHPGAIRALSSVVVAGDRIDPDAVFGAVGSIMFLDTLGIYEEQIYILWNDQCRRSTHDFIMLIRACQLGFISREELVLASIGSPDMVQLDIDELRVKVCERLLNFGGKIDVQDTGE